MKKMFRARAYLSHNPIDTVNIIGETKHYVDLAKSREKRITDDTGYFDTFKEAKEFLLEIEHREIKRLEASLGISYNRLLEIKEIEPSQVRHSEDGW